MTKKSTRKKSSSRKKKSTKKKPLATIKVGEEARKAHVEEAQQTPSFWHIIVRLLPVWVLLVVVMLLEPTLPLRAISGAVRAVQTALPDRPEPGVVAVTATIPAAIVEDLPQTASTAGPQPTSPPPAQVLPQAVPTLNVNVLPPPGSGQTGIAPVFTPEVQAWAGDIVGWSGQYDLNANLIATLMQIESCGNPTAESASGKLGLFQVPPDEFNRRDVPFDPDTNAQRGLERFGELFSRAGGDLSLAFAAYNGGERILNTSPADWSSETQTYQFWASGIYEEAQAGLRESPTLLDWYRSGGANLCAMAASTAE